MRRSPQFLLVFPALIFLAPAAAQSANVTFSGTVANLCILTLATPGALGMNSNGSVMSSDDTGGAAASLTIAATGSVPTISFAAAQLTGPTASTVSATKEIQYTSVGGASQNFTSTSSAYVMNRLIDTMTVKGRVTNAAGFATGTYTLSSTATCSQ